MDFVAVVDQVIVLLRQRGRMTYRTLQRQFQLDDDALHDLTDEILYAHPEVRDDAGRGLVWTGDTETPVSPASSSPLHAPPPAASSPPEAERRQLTVLFCDLVDSTALASQLDPEDLREVVRAYQDTCAKVIARFEGYIAQYLGDGLLVYFGYPLAHEDDARRAVRAGLGIVEALGQLNMRLTQARGVQLAVRLGVHTGLVVVGDVGGGTRQEQLALGETPNLAARLQSIAAPNTVVISAATFPLLGGFFACQPLGTPPLKGHTQPLAVYRVLYESMARSRLEAARSTGWTPLVGRDAGSTTAAGALGAGQGRFWTSRAAQRRSGDREIAPGAGADGAGRHRAPGVADAVPVLALPSAERLVSMDRPVGAGRPALRARGFPAAEAPQTGGAPGPVWLAPGGGRAAVCHPPLPAAARGVCPLDGRTRTAETADPAHPPDHPAAHCRPAARALRHGRPPLGRSNHAGISHPPRRSRSHGPYPGAVDLSARLHPALGGALHLTQVTVHRLPRRQAVEVSHHVAHGKALPSEVVEHIVVKTDGVPLFVEELTKMVLESGLLQEQPERYTLTGPLPPLAIPTTLHDSLMARLDRLAAVKGLAQLGATLGREFSYELLQAVSPWDEGPLHRGLHQLVEAEFVYQRGVPPQATYTFKHALIQDAAYQSLLRSTRQQYHQRIAQVLEARFPDTVETQPELLAQHYTAASLMTQALPYWQRAGQRALQRSAHLEAIGHLTKGLEVLAALPDTPARLQQELALQTTLGLALVATKGFASPEVLHVYTRARALCQQAGETPQVFQVLRGLWYFYLIRSELRTALELGEHLLTLAQQVGDPVLGVEAHYALGLTFNYLGKFADAQTHLAQGIALYNPLQHQTHAVRYGQDPGVGCRAYGAANLWWLGYPEQALQWSHEALRLARELAHPFSLGFALFLTSWVPQFRREGLLTHERAEAAMALAAEHGFAVFGAGGTIFRGWALAARSIERGPGQEPREEGIAQIQQGMAAWRATGAEALRPYYLALLAEASGKSGQVEEGLHLLAEARAVAKDTGECRWDAELHRLIGVLRLARLRADHAEAESCFHQALATARQQQAKSLELRAAMSLSRLWQQQGKQAEARELLAPVYGWFTEGFDTADLQEAKTLLHELEVGR